MSRHHDYWGTLVYSFDLHQPHTELQVVGRSVVETSGAPNPGPEVDWAGVDRVSDRWSEFLLASHFAPEDSSWSTTRQPCVTASTTPATPCARRSSS